MKDSPFDGMVVELGKLFHATLKRHQGIRGMDDALNYQAARNRAVDMFLVHLCRYCNVNLVTNPLHIVNETWNTIVKKRDWKADKASGGGHAHDAVQIEDTGAIPVVEDDAE